MTTLSLREEIAVEIRSHLDNIGTSYMEIGKALNEVRADFDKGADFLAWVDAEFGIKKAYAYRLMKIAETFGNDSRWQGVAMRVLAVMTQHIDNADLIEKAADLAAKGELDTKSLNALIEPVKPTVSTNETPKQSQGEDVKSPEIVPEDVDFDDEPPFDVGEANVISKATPASAIRLNEVTEAPKTAQDEDSERVKGLLSLIQSLRDTNDQLVQELAAMRNERQAKKAVAPMLPQFKSSCFYARLGLSAEEATKKTAINKAKRELVKLGYGEGHEAWKAISEAVDNLLANI